MSDGYSESDQKPCSQEHAIVGTNTLENDTQDPNTVRTMYPKTTTSIAYMMRQPIKIPILRPRISAV